VDLVKIEAAPLSEPQVPLPNSSKMLRVRQILQDSTACQALKKHLPSGVFVPELETGKYPSALLSIFPAAEKYAWLGVITEELLRIPSVGMVLASVTSCVKKWFPAMPAESLQKVKKSKTTTVFLELVKKTRAELETMKKGVLQYEKVLEAEGVQGHPDIRTETQVFEVKTTGRAEASWSQFLLQLFAYAALCPAAEEALLVLPLQGRVVRYSLAEWKGRAAFRQTLESAAKRLLSVAVVDHTLGAALRELFAIGCHIGKKKSLADTIHQIADYSKPYQIFLGNPQSTKVSVADSDLAAAAQLVTERSAKIYIHTQYIINLSNKVLEGENWTLNTLMTSARAGAAMGARGVVVHVGKSVGRPVAEALETMRDCLRAALSAATAECPILLETPAGQGTETLTDRDEFIEFVQSFADPRLRVCLDTCHVFACGYDPLEYIRAVPDGLLKLVHYNDSKEPCGSCKDRHALMGTGHIGMAKMQAIAEHCGAAGLPMVIE
jgi:deoxyribonuclease-4